MVSCSKFYTTWKNAFNVVEALDLLRWLVSSTLEALLHARRDLVLVERDVRSMLGDAN